MSLADLKVPAAVATGVIGFALGVGAGVLAMKAIPPKAEQESLSQAEMMARAGPPATMPPGMMPPAGARAMGGGPGGGRGPSAKTQLAALVVKLDQLTHKPLAVTLSDEQRRKLREQLRGLDEKDELGEEDARARLDAALQVVEGDRETLEAAGYRWPGQQGGAPRPPADAPNNPFKEGANAQHLKSLQEQVRAKAD